MAAVTMADLQLCASLADPSAHASAAAPPDAASNGCVGVTLSFSAGIALLLEPCSAADDSDDKGYDTRSFGSVVEVAAGTALEGTALTSETHKSDVGSTTTTAADGGVGVGSEWERTMRRTTPARMIGRGDLYHGMRRLLLQRKADKGKLKRHTYIHSPSGASYVDFRSYLATLRPDGSSSSNKASISTTTDVTTASPLPQQPQQHPAIAEAAAVATAATDLAANNATTAMAAYGTTAAAVASVAADATVAAVAAAAKKEAPQEQPPVKPVGAQESGEMAEPTPAKTGREPSPAGLPPMTKTAEERAGGEAAGGGSGRPSNQIAADVQNGAQEQPSQQSDEIAIRADRGLGGVEVEGKEELRRQGQEFAVGGGAAAAVAEHGVAAAEVGADKFSRPNQPNAQADSSSQQPTAGDEAPVPPSSHAATTGDAAQHVTPAQTQQQEQLEHRQEGDSGNIAARVSHVDARRSPDEGVEVGTSSSNIGGASATPKVSGGDRYPQNAESEPKRSLQKGDDEQRLRQSPLRPNTEPESVHGETQSKKDELQQEQQQQQQQDDEGLEITPPVKLPFLPHPPAPKGFTSGVCSVAPQYAMRIAVEPQRERSGSRRSAGSAGFAGSPGHDSKSEEESLLAMVAVFEDCTAEVTKVRFARRRSDLFAYATVEGTFRVCHTGDEPVAAATPPPQQSSSSTSSLSSHMPRGASSPVPSGTRPRMVSSPAAVATSTGAAAAAGSPSSRGSSRGRTGSAPVGPSASSNFSPAAAAESGPAPRLLQLAQAAGGSTSAGAAAVQRQPPRVMHELSGHTKEVTDFDWSSDDDYLCSSSADKSVRVWDVGTGRCLRIIYTQIAQLCIRFHPRNSNLMVVANAKPEVTVINFSTGRVVSHVALRHRICAVDVAQDEEGEDNTCALFAGDTEGAIHSFVVDAQSGALIYSHVNDDGVVYPAPVLSLCFRRASLLARSPVLLACCQDGSIRFYAVALELQGYLFLKCSLALHARGSNVAAAFSPTLLPAPLLPSPAKASPASRKQQGSRLSQLSPSQSPSASPSKSPARALSPGLVGKVGGRSPSVKGGALEQQQRQQRKPGEFIVTGNTQCHVCFYDFMQPRRPFVGRAVGHTSVVVDVSWNATQTLLASADSSGVVVLWTPVNPLLPLLAG